MKHRRSIRAVFRVQCGRCLMWLSRTQDYVMGTDVLPHHSERLITAERAWQWPGEAAARRAALEAGWVQDHKQPRDSGVLLCPACSVNPLGIVLPEQCPDCHHIHRGRQCGEFHCLCGVRNGE